MAGQILRGCAVCGQPFKPRHARHRHCPEHEQHGNAHRSPTTRTRPSSSTERGRILAELLAANPHCAIRGQGCTGIATTGDHIVPARDGGRYELGNLRPACATCNSSEGGKLAHTAASELPQPTAPALRPGKRVLH